MPEQPLYCAIDLDWCTYVCPCGAYLCTRYETEPYVKAWLAQHKPHTNELILEHTTADGNRAYARPEPDRLVPFPA